MMVTKDLDPDPWVIAQTIFTAVGVVAQLVGLAHQAKIAPKLITGAASRRSMEYLDDALNQTIRDVEKVIRLLHRGSDKNWAPERDFRFGEGTLTLGVEEFEQYSALVDRILSHSQMLSKATMNMIRWDPAFAQSVGVEIAESLTDIRERMRALQTSDYSTGAVLDECLLLLREFHRIVARLDRAN
jgi:hypothetical protein